MSADASAPKPPKSALAWYEHAWTALPLVLVLVGGAIGGACGGAAWGINNMVFQKLEHPLLRYVLTGLITAAAVLGYVVLASFLVRYFNLTR